MLKKSRIPGILKLDAPPRVLFKEYDELCKLATIDVYQSILGQRLQPEHLVPTQSMIRIIKSSSDKPPEPSGYR